LTSNLIDGGSATRFCSGQALTVPGKDAKGWLSARRNPTRLGHEPFGLGLEVGSVPLLLGGYVIEEIELFGERR
jgi:hypothetical protein